MIVNQYDLLLRIATKAASTRGILRQTGMMGAKWYRFHMVLHQILKRSFAGFFSSLDVAQSTLVARPTAQQISHMLWKDRLISELLTHYGLAREDWRRGPIGQRAWRVTQNSTESNEESRSGRHLSLSGWKTQCWSSWEGKLFYFVSCAEFTTRRKEFRIIRHHNSTGWRFQR